MPSIMNILIKTFIRKCKIKKESTENIIVEGEITKEKKEDEL